MNGRDWILGPIMCIETLVLFLLFGELVRGLPPVAKPFMGIAVRTRAPALRVPG